VLFTQVWWAGIIFFIISIPLMIAAMKSGKKIYESYKTANVHKRKALYIDDMLTSREANPERYMFSYTDTISKKWWVFNDKGMKMKLRADRISLGSIKIAGSLTIIISAMIAGVLITPLGKGEITTGMFIAIVQAVFNLQYMLSWDLSVTTRFIAQNIEYMKDMTRMMALSETKDALEPADEDTYGQEFESIEMKGVSFKYPGTDKYIIKDLSLKIEAGRHYAFVGINGAGKTTIIKILTGLYNEFEGEVLINGKDIRGYGLPQLKAIFSVVYQDFSKYYISIRENLMLGNDEGLSDGKLMEALETVDMKEAVLKLPDGLDTNLGKIRKKSSDISAGQWQRLTIARTLLSRSPVRILDEPTASLDAIAESSIYEMFNRISTGRTTLLITHRLGATRLADEIILIEDGKVSERGPHKELMERGMNYAKMYDSQRRWYM
jgi:ATP-binding cassette subfamily B protein